MRQIILILLLLPVTVISLHAQKISSKIQLSPGKTIRVDMEVKNKMAQQAGTQAINFSANGTARHQYQVNSVDNGNISLHHTVDRLNFQFDGMGQKKSFDSNNQADLDGPFGKQFGEILSKQYDLIIDSTGKTIQSSPDTVTLSAQDDHMVVITDMIKVLTDIIYPPRESEPCFFAVLPVYDIEVGDSWTDSTVSKNHKSVTVNTLSAITDSTIVVDYKTTSTSTERTMITGMPAVTHLNNTITGRIILDRATGLIREKTIITDSNGNTQTHGSNLPISGQSEVTIRIRIE